MTPNTLHQYRLLAKFHADRHFIYITTCRDESKEELQSYYKLTDEDMAEITKEWPAKFLVPVEDAELSDLTSSEVLWSPRLSMMDRAAQRKRRKRMKSKT
jgi:transcription initiation factor IIE alpha subunit